MSTRPSQPTRLVVWSRSLLLVFAVLALQANAREFVLYEKGVATAHLKLAASFSGAFQNSERDRNTTAWSSELNRAWSSLGTGPNALPGSLAVFGVLGPQLSAADWTAREMVGVSDGNLHFFYTRDQAIRKMTAGHLAKAHYWHQVDGGMLRFGYPPLDLIVGDDGTILAAIDPTNDDVLVERGYEPLTPTLNAWRAPSIPLASFGVRQLPRAMVEMSDGVKLATDVYLPSGDSAGNTHATILVRTPYDARPVINYAWQYVARGYAVVVQDVRGRFGSEGEFLVDIHELKDGDETLTWISKQSWCNGKIGMMGASYPGHAEWMADYHGNPALYTIVPQVSMGTPHNDMPYTGGTLDVGVAQWVLYMDGANTAKIDWASLLRSRPFAAIGKKGLGKESKLWDQIVEHQLYDDYWRACDWLLYDKNIKIPAFHISGWYDDDHPGTLANWAMMARNKRANQKMILGAWRHSLNEDRDLNGVRFGGNVIRADLNLLKEQWYDHFLMDRLNHVEQRPNVEYYSVGDNQWRTASAWPPTEAQMRAWYLHSDGGAAARKTGTLSTTMPEQEPNDPYDYDPEDPTPSLIDVSLNEQSLPDNYAPVDARKDVAIYETPKLKQPVRIAGLIAAVIYADSSAKDTDWIVRLSDVDGDGRVTRLVEGVLRARFRNSFSREELLSPGNVVRYDIKMRSHANTFLPGHRIRISVSSAAAGYIYPNSNTGENEAYATRTIIAHQNVYHDKLYPSRVELPVVSPGL
jgi:putative CocE/NonD family hydrolase